MKIDQAVGLLKLLGTRAEQAMTVHQIIVKWSTEYGSQLHIRTAQRYVSALSGKDNSPYHLVEVASGHEKEKRYYLRLSEMASWLMSEEAALFQGLSLQVVQSAFGDAVETGIRPQLDVAEHLTQEHRRNRRLRQRLRIVPDGVGRLRASISSVILRSILDALAENQRILIEYRSSSGQASRRKLMPLGLVAKDGTLYLIAVEGLSDHPMHYPLQRVLSATVSSIACQERPDFELDRYIEQSHQLSHPLHQAREAVTVRIRVAEKTLFHFQERPLSADQTIELVPGACSVVTAHIPLSVLLMPFLISLGPGIEVLEPLSLRQQMAHWIRGMWCHYENHRSSP